MRTRIRADALLQTSNHGHETAVKNKYWKGLVASSTEPKRTLVSVVGPRLVCPGTVALAIEKAFYFSEIPGWGTVLEVVQKSCTVISALVIVLVVRYRDSLLDQIVGTPTIGTYLQLLFKRPFNKPRAPFAHFPLHYEVIVALVVDLLSTTK